MFTDNWNELTPEQRYEARMQAWFASEANIDFVSDEARNAWRERMQMLRDAIELKKPKRVPVLPTGGLLPARYAGITAREVYYDYDKAAQAWLKFNADFDFDAAFSTFAVVFPGDLYNILDLKLISWPGHGTGDDVHFQYNEREWMHADEYDLLINDPSNFWQRYYLPRIFGALEPLSIPDPATDIWEPPINPPTFFPFSLEPVQQMRRCSRRWRRRGKRRLAGWPARARSICRLWPSTAGRQPSVGPPRRPTTSSATPCAERAASCSTSSVSRTSC